MIARAEEAKEWRRPPHLQPRKVSLPSRRPVHTHALFTYSPFSSSSSRPAVVRLCVRTLSVTRPLSPAIRNRLRRGLVQGPSKSSHHRQQLIESGDMISICVLRRREEEKRVATGGAGCSSSWFGLSVWGTSGCGVFRPRCGAGRYGEEDTNASLFLTDYKSRLLPVTARCVFPTSHGQRAGTNPAITWVMSSCLLLPRYSQTDVKS
ncbi:hypothetical protein EJ05DRAFT_229803 [Pseudovirgaria hyperparasitica]|uniref:Uncharacterized protein n=1 Tax=Pseudovirgaria hyperparasitica TaxID=470096 RepID=A0A6A6VQW7_9PEZI|nr:uncharacterized protein EJ05DRAFT_229803 [Pseudovirgaria hyperparasitica]KAF2752992.1 hypothetical protein EJ05DRAFT_229803 [Pseudovirgaria hyperparasitica]